MTAVAKKQPEADQAEVTTRKAVLVLPECVWQQKAGSRFCEWEAVAPEGASFDDLLDPSAWKRIQDTKRPALRQNDEIRIMAFDRSWIVWCFVAHATGNGIVLARFAETKPEGPREHLYEDDKFVVKFVGVGYAVFRRTDGQQMAPAVHSADAARGVLISLYPKTVA